MLIVSGAGCHICKAGLFKIADNDSQLIIIYETLHVNISSDNYGTQVNQELEIRQYATAITLEDINDP